MACADGMEAEKELLHALSDTRTWKIRGNHHELYGSDGKVLGRKLCAGYGGAKGDKRMPALSSDE
jgi:hypothetical protein